MFFEAFSPEIVYDSNMLEHQTNPHLNAYEKHIIAVILFVSALLGLASEADEYKTEQNIAYKVLTNKTGNDYIKSRCKLDIYYPTISKNFASVVWFHGGGLRAGNKKVPSQLMEKGFAVIAVNYRLFPKVQCPVYIEDAAAAVAWSGPGAVRGGTAVPERPHASSPRGRRARLSAVRRLRTRVCAKSTETALDRVLARARVGRAAAGVGREPRAEARLSVSIVGQPSHRGHLINGGTQRLRDKLLRLASSALAIARGGPRTCLGTGAHAQVEVVAVVVAHLVR